MWKDACLKIGCPGHLAFFPAPTLIALTADRCRLGARRRCVFGTDDAKTFGSPLFEDILASLLYWINRNHHANNASCMYVYFPHVARCYTLTERPTTDVRCASAKDMCNLPPLSPPLRHRLLTSSIYLEVNASISSAMNFERRNVHWTWSDRHI